MARIAVFLVGAVALAACSTAPADKAQTDPDPSNSGQLRRYQTYRLLPAPTHGVVQDVATGAAVARSVDETLGGKGYRQEAARPDFLVKWHVRGEFHQRPSAGTSSAMLATRQDRDGMLTLDVVDAGSNMVVWRGSAQAQLTASGAAEGRDARIQDAVRRILERFPPQ